MHPDKKKGQRGAEGERELRERDREREKEEKQQRQKEETDGEERDRQVEGWRENAVRTSLRGEGLEEG